MKLTSEDENIFHLRSGLIFYFTNTYILFLIAKYG